MRYPVHLLAEVTALLQSAEQMAANAQSQLTVAAGQPNPTQLTGKQKKQQQQVRLPCGSCPTCPFDGTRSSQLKPAGDVGSTRGGIMIQAYPYT